jgi:hypothetical protein
MDEKKKPKYITQNSRGTWEIVFLFFLKGSTQLLNLRIGHITKQDTIISPSMFEGLELVVEGGSKRLGLRNEACAQAKIGCSSQRLFFTLSRTLLTSSARRSPIAIRLLYTLIPSKTESGRAK